MIVWGQNNRLIEDYLAKRIWGGAADMPAGTFMAVTDGSEIAGAVLFHDYHPDFGTVEMTVAADNPRWLTRAALDALGRYAFDQLGCQAVIMRADEKNTRVNRIAKGIGFQRYDIPRLRGRDKGEAVYLLTEENWREFIGDYHGT